MPDFELVSSTGAVAYRLRGGEAAVVGRGSTAQVTVTDTSISRHHARLSSAGQGLAIEDLQSTNGTFLNDARVTKATATDGDVVKFGDVAFTVRRVTEEVAPGSDAAADHPLDRTILRTMMVNVSSLGALLADERAKALAPDAAPAAASLTPAQEQRLKRLELLLEVSKKLAQNVSIDALLESIVDVTCRIMDVHRVSILLVDAQSAELVPLVSRQRGLPVTDAVRLPSSILRRVSSDKVAVRTDDAVSDARFGGKSVVLQQVRAAMCTPLLSSAGELMGAIYVDRLTPVGGYGDEDLEFLVSFGGIAGAALENNRLSATLRAKTVSLSNFERYFAPDLASKIAAEREQVQLGGVKRPLAILFSDIRGFTALSERMLPEALVMMLNEYFSEMVDIVFDHGGTLDKFIGDALLANWGAPLSRADDADRALAAAIEMQRELKALNAKLPADQPRFEVGIGINWGEVFVGNIGSHRRLEYTVIGDPVNVASRLCSTAARGDILISGPLYEALNDKPEVESLAPVQLRGRAGTTAAYRVRW